MTTPAEIKTTWLFYDEISKECKCSYAIRTIWKLSSQGKITTRNRGGYQISKESLEAYLNKGIRLSNADRAKKLKDSK